MRNHLTNSELDVMAVLWELGSGTVTEVRERLDKPLAYTSVLTVLRALESKNHVRHDEEGRAFRYFPTTEPAEATDKALERFVNKVYQGSREMLIARLLSDDSVSDDELRRIRSLLNKRLKGGKL
jgi:predicted transcriptional regulator